jgi:epoxyqueuosine reductase
MSLTQRIKARALELGFDAVGVAGVADRAGAAAPPEDAGTSATQHFEAWLATGFHGGMVWLSSERSRERRADPARILPGVRSIVCLALCHEPAGDATRDRRLGRVARYAAGEDYHQVMRELLGALERFMVEELPGARTLWYSDTGAILERSLAERAGLGWIGKHSGLIAPALGSYFLLGEVLVDRELDPDPALEREHCGTCTRCLAACPTGAIVAPYQVDARRCISYLTIEHRGAVPRELRPLLGDWIFGCDVCQEVCPWNRFAPPARAARLHARAREGWTLERFLGLDEQAFRALFATSPIRRARRGGFLRNVCVALGNRTDEGAVPALARALAADPDPLLRAHAAWALGEIGRKHCDSARPEIERTLEAASASDANAEVREEARLALQGAGSPPGPNEARG